MAIRMRRGASADLDTARLQSGEIAVATNPDKVVAKTTGGAILTLATTDDLALKVDTSSVGANNGIATLDSSGKVPSSQLPSYVDDVIEGYLYEGSFYEDAQHTELITPESSKIYVDLSTDKAYRWGGSTYVDVTGASAWGEIGGTLSNQTDLATELNRAYTKTASETSSIDDLDLIPVQKISASSDGRRNIKFRNLKSALKTYFDDQYISATVQDETLILG